MRFKLRAAVAAAVLAFLLGTSALPAMAMSPQTVALQIGDASGSGYYGSYGQGIDLQPTVLSSIELPKDTFVFQAFVKDSDGVTKWLPITDFEAITLEDTNTVQPFGFRLGYDGIVSLSDFSDVPLTYPAQIRCVYKPLGADTTPTISVSETETVNVIRNTSEKVTFSTSGTIRAAGTTFKFHVSPVAGVGTIKVTIARSGSTRTYNVATDVDGNATATLRLGTKRGSYTVKAKFLGNSWGTASGTATKHVVAKH